MSEHVSRPCGLTELHLQWIDELRANGSMSAFSTASQLASQFGLDEKTADAYYHYWLSTYITRHERPSMWPLASDE